MNKVVHFEVPFENHERAKKFYSNVFGWRLDDLPEMNYTMATTVEVDQQSRRPKEAGAINGGLMKRVATAKSPVLVIDVPSIDKHISKIEAAGGMLVEPKVKIGDMGHYARVTDSEGNIIGLWETVTPAR